MHQLLDLILKNISTEASITRVSNGDIIQSLAMALAVRMKMISADEKIVEKIRKMIIKNCLTSYWTNK